MIEETSIGEQQAFAGNIHHVGEYIRQERRQLNLTQSSLGQTRYSKSYVSAVERNKIIPSPEALRFFAERLGQPSDYFKKVLEQTEQLRTADSLHNASQSAMGERLFPARDLTFLNILLDNTEHYNLQALQEYSTLTAEFIGSLPLEQQASCIFLIGLVAQEKRDLATALSAFERAFALAPPRQQPVILDELGHNYYLQRYYQIALHYHLRTLNLLENGQAEEGNGPLQFRVELHCGNDYQALGAYEQAAAMYERARTHLNTTHELKTAGVLYFGLGYCIYAHMRQLAAQTESQHSTPEEIQAQYQQAIGFLVQSRSVYHVSNDHQSEAVARLTLAQAELDLSSYRRQLAKKQHKKEGKQITANCATLLDDAEEHCRQVLLAWHNPPDDTGLPSVEQEATLYTALAYFVRIAVQRAALAQLHGYTDTALRERALAVHLCQQMLDTLYESSFSWATIETIMAFQIDSPLYNEPALPRLPERHGSINAVGRSPFSQAEVYFAAGEVAEELGRAATTHDFAKDCYSLADQCFQTSLNFARPAVTKGESDAGYMLYCYQRSIAFLQERFNVAPEIREETIQKLLDILKAGLYGLQTPVLLAN